MSELDDIGSIHVSFTYPTAMAAKLAWERTEKRTRGISVWRLRIGAKEYVIACGEDANEIDKAQRLLARGGEETVLDPIGVETIRNRRRRFALELIMRDGERVRRRVRYGEAGIPATPWGETISRRPQG